MRQEGRSQRPVDSDEIRPDQSVPITLMPGTPNALFARVIGMEVLVYDPFVKPDSPLLHDTGVALFQADVPGSL